MLGSVGEITVYPFDNVRVDIGADEFGAEIPSTLLDLVTSRFMMSSYR